MTPRKPRPSSASAAQQRHDDHRQMDHNSDLRPVVEKVMMRLQTLEGEVGELKGIVDEAIDWRKSAQAERRQEAGKSKVRSVDVSLPGNHC